ncbi:hypothetical protein CHUAL_000217 [Chamberlinius hualienensis]
MLGKRVALIIITISFGDCFIFDNGLLPHMSVLENFVEGLVSHGQPQYPVLPEATLTALEIIEFHGYKGEVHDVVTSDGYIIEVHRLRSPYCLYSPVKGSGNGHPVFIQHGVLSNSGSWLINGKADSLAFVLADDCYDVWLGNLRGNRYARRHKHLAPKDPEFWDFTTKLSIVAHSMGTTLTMLMLAGQQEYNNKVDLVILQSPVMFGRFLKNPLRVILNHMDFFTKLVNNFGFREFPPFMEVLRPLSINLCTQYPMNIVCEALINMIGGYDDYLMDKGRMHLFFGHYDTSSWTLGRHYGQILTSTSSPKRFDRGPSLNMAKYGKLEPPEYKLKQVTVPVVMFSGYMDLYVDKKDMERLASHLSNVKLMEEVEPELWSHQDFVIGVNLTKFHNKRLIQVLQKFRNT